MTANMRAGPADVLDKCFARGRRYDLDESSVADVDPRAGHATWSTASHGASATAVGVTPAIAMASRQRWE